DAKKQEMARLNVATMTAVFERMAGRLRELRSRIEKLESSTVAETTARLTDLQNTREAMVEAVPVALQVIVDSRPDATGHLSRLRITRRERDDIVRAIDAAFKGQALQDPANAERFGIGAAAVVRSKLLEGWTFREQK